MSVDATSTAAARRSRQVRSLGPLPVIDPVAVARGYLQRWRPEVGIGAARLTPPADGAGRLGEAFGRVVADHFDQQPRRSWNADLARRYRLLRVETRRQFEAIEQAGVRIEPWLGTGQPYRGARELCDQVRSTGTLHVFLSRAGHGPPEAAGHPGPVHPLRIPSGIVRAGVEFDHNDLLRAVHDFFGHVMFGNGMDVAGEFRAAYCHLAMYSDDVHPVLFSEHVSQLCWFFFGAHLRTARGRLPRRGEPGWLPPARRPYAEQKVFSCPPEFVAWFRTSLEEVAA